MKIAITSDLHLKQREQTPERYEALSYVIDEMNLLSIGILVIAGDLFDKQANNYADFEKFCIEKDIKSKNISVFIIAGNHDSSINQKYFDLENIRVLATPGIINFGQVSLLFLPYMAGKSMGDALTDIGEKIKNIRVPYIIIGHGDYISGLKPLNPYEPGIYMPLTRTDIDFYGPQKVFLGHIHKKANLGKVFYPGSPCGLDINETGKRSFLTMDSDTLEVSESEIKTGTIYLNETVISLPLPDEEKYLRKKILEIIEKNKLTPDDFGRIEIRLAVRGYTEDKSRLAKIIDSVLANEMKGFSYYKNEQPDLTEVSIPDDPDRIKILEKVVGKIAGLDFDSGEIAGSANPNDNTGETVDIKDLVLEKAMKLVFRQN
jgi:DNA repair protein SbcD/Mre11